MTTPDRPTPQQLPAPGPPPHPSDWHYTDTQPGPGPKPAGPSGPTPTGPGPQRGHLPIGIDSDPREARRATGPGSASSVAMVAAGVGQLPRLGQVIRDAERLAAQLISVLERDYDVASAPSAEDDPTGLGFVEVRLMSARADVRSALLMLDQITTLGLPPTGSAVQIAVRQSTNSASLPGGPPNHLADSPASGGLLPGLVDASGTPTVRRTGESIAPDAGESSDPTGRPCTCRAAYEGGGHSHGCRYWPSSGPGLRLSQRAPDGNGVRPGAGFTLPVTKRFLMDPRSVQSLAQHAVALNESLARRSR